MKRLIVTTMLLLSCTVVHAQEIIADFSKRSVPILNEELRRLKSSIVTVDTLMFCQPDGTNCPPSTVTSPGGSDTYVQYNDGGVFGGDSGFTFNETANSVAISPVGSSSAVKGLNLVATQSSTGDIYGEYIDTQKSGTGNSNNLKGQYLLSKFTGSSTQDNNTTLRAECAVGAASTLTTCYALRGSAGANSGSEGAATYHYAGAFDGPVVIGPSQHGGASSGSYIYLTPTAITDTSVPGGGVLLKYKSAARGEIDNYLDVYSGLLVGVDTSVSTNNIALQGNGLFGINVAIGGGANDPQINYKPDKIINKNADLEVEEHLQFTTTTPTYDNATCGGGAGGIVTYSTDQAGEVTFGGASTVTGCQITFGKSFGTNPAPSCICKNVSNKAFEYCNATTTVLTIGDGSTDVSGDTVEWICGAFKQQG